MSNQQTGKKKIGLNAIISWGASVVIIGLMFKILHWHGGEYMIGLGLATEALLFLILGFASMSVEADDPNKDAAGGGGALGDLLASSITPKVIEGLSMGFQKFNKTVESVNQIAASAGTTQNFIKEIETAVNDVKKFRDNMTSVSSGFDQFNKSLQAVSQMAATSQGMMKEFESAGSGLKSFAKNVSDMNVAFDTFNKTLQGINQMTAASQNMMKEFETATNSIKAYNKNLADLSKIYSAQLEAFRKN